MGHFLVTGGAGFIGSHLVDALLRQGHRLRVLDDLSAGQRDNIDRRAQLLVGDVTDAGLAYRAMAGMDGCYHLADARSIGTASVLWAARRSGGMPVVYASSAAVYGVPTALPLHEEMAALPLSVDGADDLVSELQARAAWRLHATPTLGLRFFNVYGPRQDPQSRFCGAVLRFAEGVRDGRVITVHGGGAQTRDYVFIDDVVDHLLAAMARLRRRPEAGVCNVCTGLATSILGLMRAVTAEAGRMPRIAFADERRGEIRHVVGSRRRAEAALRLAPPTSLRQGLGRLADAERPAVLLAG